MDNGFNWSTLDFVVAGAIILLFVLGLKWILKRVNKKYRLVASAGLVLFTVIIWAELAVGIFSSVLAGS
ncbi:hypothetical protein M8998_00850 [Sphingobacterium sp. lm-10]|uniref:hypothetical protein n=1 Tax=Sphingobacterium sp. lm-10 TaxID=2944904 RepID=UPI0020216803|nr:hypothetical protein [Sphingobacterium sp. lm-10]MCL7986477.1 hypothetical protein [Sphingobacterium sp. lm-10]